MSAKARNRRITRIDPDGNVTVLCDNYKGKKLNSPNDLWRDKKGGIYFSDPSWVYKKEESELPGQYVFYLPADSNEPIIVIDDMVGPNGSSAQKTANCFTSPTIQGARRGYIKSKTTAHCLTKSCSSPIGADGMELDEQGNLYLTDLTGKGINIVSPEGKKIGYISVPNSTSNLCFGGKDGKTLFITARDSLYSIQMNVKGQ